MIEQANYRALGCAECSQGEALGFDFSMAFQPIVDIRQGVVFAQEALARGLGGESAATVFRHVNPDNQYRFDQTCRVKAIKLAAELGIQSNVSINFMPNAVYKPELCIRTTLNAAQDYGFPAERIIFEFTENERVADPQHLLDIINCYKSLGFKTALDDFGAGYAGLNLLSKVQPPLAVATLATVVLMVCLLGWAAFSPETAVFATPLVVPPRDVTLLIDAEHFGGAVATFLFSHIAQ